MCLIEWRLFMWNYPGLADNWTKLQITSKFLSVHTPKNVPEFAHKFCLLVSNQGMAKAFPFNVVKSVSFHQIHVNDTVICGGLPAYWAICTCYTIWEQNWQTTHTLKTKENYISGSAGLKKLLKMEKYFVTQGIMLVVPISLMRQASFDYFYHWLSFVFMHTNMSFLLSRYIIEHVCEKLFCFSKRF